MRVYGFSTGAVALGDFTAGVAVSTAVAASNPAAIELSALRGEELLPLLEALPSLDLAPFRYASIHAPSQFDPELEGIITDALLRHTGALNIVVHPDAIRDFQLWRPLGSRLCIENMDKRKPIGRNCHELATVFNQLPDASFCLDLGHARQVDPTMCDAREMIRVFSSRLRQIHLSEVTTNSRHESLSFAAILAFRQIAAELPDETPIIIESVLGSSPTTTQLSEELTRAEYALPARNGRSTSRSARRSIPPILMGLRDFL